MCSAIAQRRTKGFYAKAGLKNKIQAAHTKKKRNKTCSENSMEVRKDQSAQKIHKRLSVWGVHILNLNRLFYYFQKLAFFLR